MPSSTSTGSNAGCGAGASLPKSQSTATRSPTVSRGARGGRRPAFDKAIFRDRNVVERCFARLKQFRAIATRFDKLAVRYHAGLVMASLILWLRDVAR
jgi:transposase